MECLVKAGVRKDIIKAICPPILCADVPEGRLGPALDRFLTLDADELILISNVARIDYFKNLDLLVDAAIDLLCKGTPLRVLVTGGGAGDADKRHALRRSIPEAFRARILITEKLDQASMLALFERVRGRGMFVCTSRYETLGITPLEAALSGVCTLSPDLDCVEFSRYFPQEYRYPYSVLGLAGKVAEARAGGWFRNDRLCDHLSERISRRLFEETFMARWKEMSQVAVPCEGTVETPAGEKACFSDEPSGA
jgi:glycosyltransferase involved in cell wall biosynthesis